MDGALRGRADLDDALQHGLLRIVRDYDGWPPDQTAEQRLAYARKTLKWAAADVLRQQYGRGDRAPRTQELPISLADYDESPGSERGNRDALRGLIRRRLSDLATVAIDDDGRLDRELYVGALAALDPLEHEVVTEHARGFEHKELAERLGQSEQKIRATYSEARKLLLTLLGCARGHDLSEAESFDLSGYLEGTLTDRRHRRLVKRHLRNCDNCQAIAALRGDVDPLSARLMLPLPLIVAILGEGAAAGAVGLAGSAAGPAAGAGGASSAAGATGGAASGGLLTSAGGKLAAGLAAAAIAAGGATAATQLRVPDGTPAAEGSPADMAPVAPRPVRPPPLAATPEPTRDRRRSRTRGERAAPRGAAPGRQAPLVAARPAEPVSTPPPAQEPQAAPPPPQSAPSGGGEFVLGGG